MIKSVTIAISGLFLFQNFKIAKLSEQQNKYYDPRPLNVFLQNMIARLLISR